MEFLGLLIQTKIKEPFHNGLSFRQIKVSALKLFDGISKILLTI